MKNFIFGVHGKIQFLGGGGLHKTNMQGGLSKKVGALTVYRFKGGLGRKKGSVFDWRG